MVGIFDWEQFDADPNKTDLFLFYLILDWVWLD